MLPRKIISNEREKIKKGFDIATDIVASTYGPGGSNVALGRFYTTALVTNDGVSVAKEVHLNDEVEDIGAGFVRDLTYEADQGGGDGTTTAAVLARGIIDGVWNDTFSGSIELQHPKKVADSLIAESDRVCEELDKQTKPIKGYNDILNVATVSVESEKHGAMIADTFKQVGEHGYVYVEHDYGFDIKTRIIDGFNVDMGLPSVDFSSSGAYTTELGLAHIIVTDQEIDSRKIGIIMNAIKTSNIQSLAIVASGYTEEVLASLTHVFPQSTLRGGKLAPIIPLTMPVTHRELILRDLAAVSGAKFMSDDFSTFQAKDMGEPFSKILIKKNKTYFIGTPNDVEEYVADLLKQKDDMIDADKDRMDKRVARLTGSVGVIKVGGEVDADRLYWYHKIKDAVNATRSAIKYGVVKGGGIALEKAGYSYPKEVIELNMGEPVSDKVLDSVSVTKNSVRKAFSAARQLLLTKYVITNHKPSMTEESSFLGT